MPDYQTNPNPKILYFKSSKLSSVVKGSRRREALAIIVDEAFATASATVAATAIPTRRETVAGFETAKRAELAAAAAAAAAGAAPKSSPYHGGGGGGGKTAAAAGIESLSAKPSVLGGEILIAAGSMQQCRFISPALEDRARHSGRMINCDIFVR